MIFIGGADRWAAPADDVAADPAKRVSSPADRRYIRRTACFSHQGVAYERRILSCGRRSEWRSSGNAWHSGGRVARPFGRVLAKHPAGPIKASVAASHEAAGGGLAGYLHAYRRHWFLATSLGLICGAAAAVAVWLSATTSFTSSAVIQVASVPNDLIPAANDNNANFELYKGTQMQLLKSDFVLIAGGAAR